MHRGLGTLGVAYIVVAGLYAGAMYVASERSLSGDIGLVASNVAEAARTHLPIDRALSGIREPAEPTPAVAPPPVAILRATPADAARGGQSAQIALFVSPPAESILAMEDTSGAPIGGKAEKPRAEFSEAYFAPIAAAELRLDVEARLRERLTSDLFAGFDLFIYVSKAADGPWAQKMYVFAKDGGDLMLLHDWPVSTGRERGERTPAGRNTSSVTPAGYFQFDRNRMFRNYHSVQWDAPMPNAMFFNWMDRGMLTGIAIHGVVGSQVSHLGDRASAGCIRLSPEAAATLFRLVREEFRGAVPAFAFDSQSASLSRDGELARGESGRVEYSDGYNALIIVDTFGGAAAEPIF